MDAYDRLKAYARRKETKRLSGFVTVVNRDIPAGPVSPLPPGDTVVGKNSSTIKAIEDQMATRLSGSMERQYVEGCPPPWPPTGWIVGAGQLPWAERRFDIQWYGMGSGNNRFGAEKNIACLYDEVATFRVTVGLLKFDTSTLPDDALITNAVLRLYGTAAGHNDRGIAADWHPWTGEHASDEDWSVGEGPGTAHPGTRINDIYKGTAWEDNKTPITRVPDDKWMDFPLINAGTNISKTGPTYLRIFIDGGAPEEISRDIYVAWGANSCQFVNAKPLFDFRMGATRERSWLDRSITLIGPNPLSPELVINYA